MLCQDLAWFQLLPSRDRPSMPQFNDLANLLGAMYVMEGSTLGGQFIARHVEIALGLQRGFGNAYFIGHGERTGAMWKGFCEILSSNIPDDQTDGVVEGARAMFETYGVWMQGRLSAHDI